MSRPNLYDLAYASVLLTTAPLWLLHPKWRRKVTRALSERTGHDLPLDRRDVSKPGVLIHAVSLGEINATKSLVTELSAVRADLQFIVTVTTDTGFARGQELYGSDPRVTLIRYPLDFTKAISRVLDRLKPSIVVLMELEVWPNFMAQCERRGIPVLLVNGRLTESSFQSYKRFRPLIKGAFARLAAACVQDETYAKRFEQLGVPAQCVQVTGTMKFDGAQVVDQIEGADEVAQSMGLTEADPVLVCGSTGPGEEALVLGVYRELLNEFPNLRLVIVPRHPERFADVAAEARRSGFEVIRRSERRNASLQSAIRDPNSAILLGDTMGEMRKFYSLATVVFVGRSLVDLGPRQHGSDMIEPAALGKPVIVGPFTGNFADVMSRFRKADAMVEVSDAQTLRDAVGNLLRDPQTARSLGERARAVVREGKGATAKHVHVIIENL